MLDQDIKEIFFSHEQIVDRCKELGKEISEDYKGTTPIFIGLLNGAVPFVAELIKHVTIDIITEFVSCRSYEGCTSTGKLEILTPQLPKVEGRDVIIFDDIFDTGLTITFVKDLIESLGAKSVKTCCLLNKKEAHGTDMVLDYQGFDVQNQFVVGFGLDYNKLYRNLDYIGILKPEVYNK